MAAGAVYTRLYIEGNEYFMTLKKAQAQTQEWAKDTTKNVNTVGRDFANLARSVIGITASFQAVKKVVSEGIDFNKFVSEQTAAFSVMMKSTDAAKAKMQELYTFAVESPLTFKETVSASKQLLAYGFSAESLVKNMEMLGTVAKATGHSLDDISYVYGTLKTQGRAYSRDLMQFAMRGIPIYDELASVMGVTTQQIKKLTEQGAVGFEQVEKAFKNMTGEGGRFAGMMDAYMKTLSGQLSMFGDIAQQSAGKIASGTTTALTEGIGGIMDALKDSSGAFTNLGTDLGMVASAMLSVVEAAIRLTPAIVLIVKTLIVGKILQMITKLPGLVLAGSAALKAMTISIMSVNAAFSTLGTGAVWSLKLIGGQLAVLGTELLALMANPAFLAIAGLATGLAVTATAMARAKAADVSLRETNPREALRQNVIGNMQGSFAADATGSATSIQYTTTQVRDAAKEFNLSLSDTVKILRDLGVVTNGTYTEIQNAITKGEDKLLQTASRAMKNRWEIEGQWYATFAGKSAADYTNIPKKESKGVLAANDYIATFETDRQAMKDALGYVFNNDDLTDTLTKEMTALKEKLIEGASVLNYDDTQFDDILRARIKAIEKLIADGAEKAHDLWFTREWQAKASIDKLDDLDLERDKAQATAIQKMQKKEITEKEYADASLAINEWYYNERQALEKERLEKLYTTLKDGNSEMFSLYRQWAAQDFSAGDYGSGLTNSVMAGFEGTTTGKFITSTDKAAQALINLGESAAKATDDFVSQLLDKIKGIDISQSIDNITTGIADFVNNIFGWGDDAADSVENLQDAVSNLEDLLGRLQDEFDALIARAEELIGIQVDSMQALYEVGAMSGSQYETAVNDLWAQNAEELKAAYELAGQTYPEDYATEGTLTDVYAALEAVAYKLGVTQTQLTTTQTALDNAGSDTSTLSDASSGALIGAGVGSIFGPVGTGVGAAIGAGVGALGDLFGWWDVGSTNIPKDQMGTVHAGEAIIPQTFAEGIRSGEMVLSGTDEVGSGGSPVYVTVNVEGSVSAENDLATSVAQAIYTQRKRGLLTV